MNSGKLHHWIWSAQAVLVVLAPQTSWASTSPDSEWVSLTGSTVGLIALFLFAASYLAVMLEEFTQLRKSKPVILTAGIIWGLIAWQYRHMGLGNLPEEAFKDALLEFAELFLFLLAAMTYVNSMQERQVFESLRAWLARRNFSYRMLFWATGTLAFFLSPIIDNLTTALVMCAVVMAVGKGNDRFIGLACVNIVVAANAGGAFSPFGDITTLMVWQQGKVEFFTFSLLFIPSVVNFLVPALWMHFFIPGGLPEKPGLYAPMRRGAVVIMGLFILTIITAVCYHNYLRLPPMLGMITGLAYLQFYGYYLKKTHVTKETLGVTRPVVGDVFPTGKTHSFDIYNRLARAEWDTLLFFYGVVLCVGGLGFMGYLTLLSDALYGTLGFTWANIAVGVLSSVIDNIPVMYAVLSMSPDMSLGQWLLVTLTAGVGGSLLSIGSAAGVALMGQARGKYTFFSHLKWTPVIALGYAASIMVHQWINAATF